MDSNKPSTSATAVEASSSSAVPGSAKVATKFSELLGIVLCGGKLKKKFCMYLEFEFEGWLTEGDIDAGFTEKDKLFIGLFSAALLGKIDENLNNPATRKVILGPDGSRMLRLMNSFARQCARSNVGPSPKDTRFDVFDLGRYFQKKIGEEEEEEEEEDEEDEEEEEDESKIDKEKEKAEDAKIEIEKQKHEFYGWFSYEGRVESTGSGWDKCVILKLGEEEKEEGGKKIKMEEVKDKDGKAEKPEEAKTVKSAGMKGRCRFKMFQMPKVEKKKAETVEDDDVIIIDDEPEVVYIKTVQTVQKPECGKRKHLGN